MVDDSHEGGELRPAYRTLDEPIRFLGVSLGGWVALAVAGALGYGWLLLSPLGFRASVSVAVIGLGAPAGLLLLREPSTVGPGRLLLAVVRWRARGGELGPSAGRVRAGGVRLAAAPVPSVERELEARGSVPWPAESERGGRA